MVSIYFFVMLTLVYQLRKVHDQYQLRYVSPCLTLVALCIAENLGAEQTYVCESIMCLTCIPIINAGEWPGAPARSVALAADLARAVCSRAEGVHSGPESSQHLDRDRLLRA